MAFVSRFFEKLFHFAPHCATERCKLLKTGPLQLFRDLAKTALGSDLPWDKILDFLELYSPDFHRRKIIKEPRDEQNPPIVLYHECQEIQSMQQRRGGGRSSTTVERDL